MTKWRRKPRICWAHICPYGNWMAGYDFVTTMGFAMKIWTWFPQWLVPAFKGEGE